MNCGCEEIQNWEEALKKQCRTPWEGVGGVDLMISEFPGRWDDDNVSLCALLKNISI